VNHEPSAEPGRPVPRWVGPAFGLLALGTVPWTVYLALTLDPDVRTVHYDAAWVGFDLMLLLGLAATAYYAWQGSGRVALSATATATLLVVDAWFDVLTTPARHGLELSLILAVFVELPLAGVCLWIATHTRQVLLRRVELLTRRAQRAERAASAARNHRERAAG
jgi:hypothetical protein